MKRFFKVLLAAICAAVIALPVFTAACAGDGEPEFVDYVSNLKLDMQTSTKKLEVSIRLLIDGDTTHFDPVSKSQYTTYNKNDFVKTEGYIKARYLAINTPESTGKIEEWGKTASLFTAEKLNNAKTIIIESDDENWNVDSTGERYTLWVWYMPKDGTEFRNLNIEILQEGLAIASSTSSGRYGETADAALEQAKLFKKHIFSDDIDENFYYGEAVPVTLKELRCHIEEYNGVKVRVTGTITCEFGNSVYMEEKDEDTGIYFGIAVFYGYTSGPILEILRPGNMVEVVGGVTDFYGSWQISGVMHDDYALDTTQNTNLISEGHAAAYEPVSAYDIQNGSVDIFFDQDDKVTLSKAAAIMSTTVSLENLYVIDAYTTKQGNSAGAMSLTCTGTDSQGRTGTIVVRTEVLKDAEGNLLTQDMFLHKHINVKGLIEYYSDGDYGPYQVKCYRTNQLEVLD